MVNAEATRHEPERQPAFAPADDLRDIDLEVVNAGKVGGNSNGGNTPLTRMRARLLDEVSIHLVPAALAVLAHSPLFLRHFL